MWYGVHVFQTHTCGLFFFSELTFQKMTVGKIYAGLLIAENWKAYKASQTKIGSRMMVSSRNRFTLENKFMSTQIQCDQYSIVPLLNVVKPSSYLHVINTSL